MLLNAQQRSTDAVAPLLSLSDVSFAVEGRTLLHPLTLELGSGRSIALIGHNGSGKSTLLKLIGRQQADIIAGDTSELRCRELGELRGGQRPEIV